MANQRPYFFTALKFLYSGQSVWIEMRVFAVGKCPTLTHYSEDKGDFLFIAHFLIIDISPFSACSVPPFPSQLPRLSSSTDTSNNTMENIIRVHQSFIDSDV